MREATATLGQGARLCASPAGSRRNAAAMLGVPCHTFIQHLMWKKMRGQGRASEATLRVAGAAGAWLAAGPRPQAGRPEHLPRVFPMTCPLLSCLTQPLGKVWTGFLWFPQNLQ